MNAISWKSWIALCFFLIGITPAVTVHASVFPFPHISPPITITSNGGGDEANIVFPIQNPIVTRVTASGAAYNNVSFSIIGGTDSNFFSIHPYTGELFFLGDSMIKSSYEVTVVALDSEGSADSQIIHVTPSKISHTLPKAIGSTCDALPVVFVTEQNAISSFEVWVFGTQKTPPSIVIDGTPLPQRLISIWDTNIIRNGYRVHVDLPDEYKNAKMLDIMWGSDASGSVCNTRNSLPVFSSIKRIPNEDIFSDIIQPNGGNKESSNETRADSQQINMNASDPSNATCPRKPTFLWGILLCAQLLSIYLLLVIAKESPLFISIGCAGTAILVGIAWVFGDRCHDTIWVPVSAIFISCAAIIIALRVEGKKQKNK